MAEGRANYFFCVRVTDPSTRHNIENALDWIIDKDPQYKNFCYTKEMLHVTLCEVTLQSDEDVAQASKVLTDLRSELRCKAPTDPLVLKGISNFHDKVMYAKVEHGQSFREFADFLRSKVKEAGVTVNESHDFTAHMTILKVTGVKARKAKVDNLNPWLYVNLKNTLFGEQEVRSVHLCKMGAGRRDDGFYLTPEEITL